ncbi:MAG: LON peptidase substrate-binding domain-containing protein [Rhodospirillales bacterium]|jgi:Lon protease-like protein
MVSTDLAAGLPTNVPVFPLAGVLLLPRAHLPLHIFEPRYRAMTEDALAGDGMIAMIQPRDPSSAEVNPELYPVACLGRIVNEERLEDGRWQLTLEGVIRLRVTEELPLRHGYRSVQADYSEFVDDLRSFDGAKSIDRDALLAAFFRYLGGRGLSTDQEAISRLKDEPLVNALAMACPFYPAEKQALLQSKTVMDRAEMLQALLELSSRPEAANDDEPPRPN